MCKVILMILLAMVNNSAMAEWVKIGNVNNVTTYADPATIHRKDNMVTMLLLTNSKTASPSLKGKPYISMKALLGFYCEGEKFKFLSTTFYSENMGEGDIVEQNNIATSWINISPSSMEKIWLQFACG